VTPELEAEAAAVADEAHAVAAAHVAWIEDFSALTQRFARLVERAAALRAVGVNIDEEAGHLLSQAWRDAQETMSSSRFLLPKPPGGS